MSNSSYSVQYTVFNKDSSTKRMQKDFKSAEAREKFLDKLDEQGKLASVEAFADPR